MEPTKRCCTCHELRPLSEFNPRRAAADGLHSRCRACARAWYIVNREQHGANVRRRTAATRLEHKRRIGDYLLEHPCVDCGETDVRVLDCDHEVGHVEEERHRGAGRRVRAVERHEAEIAKCSVRCANCHRRVTWERRQDWRSALAADAHRDAAELSARRLAAVLR